ncbi:hypothetical protein NL676_010902 [Syzygium grande]|nr:hypothetical protein NL676_010902 [Syzygium grande]
MTSGKLLELTSGCFDEAGTELFLRDYGTSEISGAVVRSEQQQQRAGDSSGRSCRCQGEAATSPVLE